MKNFKKILFLFFIFFIYSCSKDLLKEAEKLYEEKKFNQALKYYEKYIEISKNPQLKEYSLYKAGLASVELGNCLKSKTFFESLIKNYPQSKYRDEAYFRIIRCPNYFYSRYQKLTYGDSDTFGKNAKEEIIYTEKNFKKIKFISKIYSGKKLLSKRKGEIIFDGYIVKEKLENNEKIIFLYNQYFSNFPKNNIKFKVEEANIVKVKAGNFYNCIKVISDDNEIKMINYYAPEVGRILTSSLYKKEEKKIMELIKYE